MDHSQIIFLRCFSNISYGKRLIIDEPLYNLSQLKFEGEDGISKVEHIPNFVYFCEFVQIDCEDVALILLFLTLES